MAPLGFLNGMSANFIDLSGGRFRSQPTLERSRMGMPRWPLAAGAAVVAVIAIGVISRQPLPPPPGPPPAAEFVLPPGYAAPPPVRTAALAVPAAAPALARPAAVIPSAAVKLAAATPAPDKPRPKTALQLAKAARAHEAETVTSQPAAAGGDSGVSGLF